MKSYLNNAFLVDVDGVKKSVLPANGNDFTLAELHNHLDCTITQVVRTIDGNIMIVDGVGKLNPNKKVNVKATLLYSKGFIDQIVGKALVCHPSMYIKP